MSTTLFFWLYPQRPARLREQAVLTKFLSAAVAQGFLLTTHEAYPALLQQIMQAPKAITAAMSEELSIMASEYCGEQREEFTCTLLHVPSMLRGSGFHLDFWLSEPAIVLMVDDISFKYYEPQLQNYLQFIELVKLLCQQWSPLYGYLDDGPKWDVETVQALKADHLDEITIFGPQYVDHIGRERFQDLPIWQTLDLADGGIIVVVGTFALYTQPDLHVSPKLAAAQLGLQAPGFF